MSSPIKTESGIIWSVGDISFRSDSVNDGDEVMKISNDGTGSKLLQILGKLEATQKSFVVTSPDGKRLEYGTLEGPEYGIFCRGHLIGDNIIELPEDWKWLADEESITVQLTPVGKWQPLSISKIEDYVITIAVDSIFKSKKKIDCYYLVHAERKDVKKLKND